MISKTLTTVAKTLLADRTFDIEFHGYLSNHAKHAIIALDRLQAPERRVQEYWDIYTDETPYQLQLHPVDQKWETVKPVSQDDWFHQRGKKIDWQGQVAFLQETLHNRFHGDTNKLVKHFSPGLLSGITGALTHGIIHLGWAIDAGSPWMILEGLAYLNFAHLGVDETKLKTNLKHDSDKSLFDSLIRVADTFEKDNLQHDWVEAVKMKYDETFHPELVSAGFQWQLAKVLHEAHPVATEIPEWLVAMPSEGEDKLWESLYRDTTLLYLATRNNGNGNFVILHAITSLWGLEHVLKVVDDPEVTIRALQQYYASLVCLLATAGFPSTTTLRNAKFDSVDKPDLDWDPLVERAVAETEEHNIKLVYVSRELWNRYGRWSGFSEAARTFTLTPNVGPASSAFSATD